jgi:hypothetical protein
LVAGRRGRKFDPGSFWGLQTGPNPTDRAKLGSKRHLISMDAEFRWPFSSRGPIAMTRDKPSHWLMPSQDSGRAGTPTASS